jgi:hypothetical protein
MRIKYFTGNKINRRNFIQLGSSVAGGMVLLPLIKKNHTGLPENSTSEPFWYQKPLLIMHTVLREIDARNYNADSVVKYLKKTSCNTLVVNAGGIVDFFQNPLAAANLNPFMGKRDILGETTQACHDAGIRVIARVDFRGVEEHIYRKFPEWFMKNAAQEPVVAKGGIVPIYNSCYLGHYRTVYASEFISYVLKTYDVDGIWHNAPGVDGICYCPACKESYFAATGKDIPLEQTAAADELNQYMDWKIQVVDNHMAGLKKTIKSFGEDKAYCAEIFSIYSVERLINSGIDLRNARAHFDFLVSVAFLTGPADRDHYYCDLNYASTIIIFLKSMVPEREAIVLYGENGTSHRMVIDPPLDLNIWLWEILSAGGRFWNCYFTGPYPAATNDRRNAFNNVGAYSFVKKHEKILMQHVPVANVGIYYSRPTRVFYQNKSQEGDQFGTAIRGMINVLMENHILYDFILNDQITREALQKYAIIILPDVRCMSDEELKLLKDYVSDGGNLIATYATSLHSPDGKERRDFGLTELFGVHYSGKKANTRIDNYQYILQPEHPVVKADSKDTELLFNAGYTLLCTPEKQAEVICTLVPTIPNQPPDMSWVEKFSTEFPTITQNNYGKGKVLYFANQPDSIAYTIGHPDVRNLLLRSIRLLEGSSMILETSAPESVHIGLTKSLLKQGLYILSIVNTTSGPVRPVRSLVPVYNINVRLNLDGKSLDNIEVLRSQGNYSIKTKELSLYLHIDKLEDFCAFSLQMNT